MIITLLVRQHVSLTNDLLIEALILLVDPLFGLFAGLGHIAEVFLHSLVFSFTYLYNVSVSS